MSRQKFDLLVIGGGITGAGVARDAALRGLNVALVEAADFASGTSSRSSKLVHGGLRYLAQGDVQLVREAATERLHLRRIAPHLAQPIPFVVPAHSKAGIAVIRTGMWTYEKLGKVPADERHTVWSQKQLAQNEPVINQQAYAGAVVYQECMTEDSRLTLANIRSARQAGAQVINYAPVTKIVMQKNQAAGVIIRDALTHAEFELSATVLVNAAGPWVDAIRHLESTAEPNRLQLTKGIHVVVPHASLPLNRTTIFSASDKRSIFAIPKDNSIYIGTTDTFHPDPNYWPGIKQEDVHYLLENFNAGLQTTDLTDADVTAAWSGVRPLVSQAGKSPSEISRKDEVWTGPAGIMSIAGGKLTAYRKMAERIVDEVQTRLDQAVTKCKTSELPLPGGDRSVFDTVNDPSLQNLGRQVAARLVRLYGTEATDVAARGGDVAAEVRQAVLVEGAVTLEDYWVRRSMRAWFDEDAGFAALPVAASIMAGLLGWTDEFRDGQIVSCQEIHNQSMSWR